ncbi:oligosaccharide flippase family protein [Vibrio cholerae]|uniref:oligosaccharide flippase family protein n=1 Tax=Vibrio cholerae TaxID=666 RepID=UPI002062B5FB|nr:O100 family O-antigen flippase [Vibrio cholerae]BCN20286.1 putative O-antigen flippase [Vibrio cholerae]GIA08414.1 putative polisoprenol-linked O-antigen transporter [Vibrio cholerae]
MQEVKLKVNIIYLIIMQLGNYIAPLLVLPYLSRVLGLDGFGVVAIAISLCAIALIITDYGFGISAPYWLARNKTDKSAVASYVGAIFFIKMLLFLLSASVVLIYFNFASQIPREPLLYFAILVCVFLQTFQINWFFLGIEKMKNITIFMVIAKVSYLILVFLLVKHSSDITLVLVCYAISNFLATSLGIFFLYKEKYWISKPTKMQTWDVFKDSGLFFVSRLSVGVYTSASTFLVGNFAGAGAAAIYNVAEKLYMAGQSATSPVSQALYPYLARTGDKQALYKFVVILLIPLSVVVSSCIYFSEPIIILIFGEDFIAATELLRIFLLTLLVNFVGINFGYPAFATIGKVNIANKTVIFASVLQVMSIVTLYSMSAITAKNICLSVFAIETVVMLIRMVLYWLLKNRYGRND